MSNRSRSELWKHFSKTSENTAKCGYCTEAIRITGGSTGNLTRHLKRKHPTVPVQENASKSSRISQTCSTTSQSESTSTMSEISGGNNLSEPGTSLAEPAILRKPSRQQSLFTEFVSRPISISKSNKFDRQIVKLIVKQYLPFAIVESEELKELVKMMCPGYQMPSRKTVSQSLIPKLYNEVLEDVKMKIEKARAVCLTTDSWTSINNESFVAITGHYIDGDTLHSSLLGCFKYSDAHTSQNLAAMLQEFTQEWNLTNKITAVVTDNAANVVGAVRVCNWRHLSCFAHSINLVVQKGIDAIRENLVGKVKSIVEYFKRSSSALQKLKEIQKQMDLPDLKLKQDVVTRWNSTYDMLHRILQIKEAVIATLAIKNKDLNTLSDLDWEELQTVVDILWVFNDITLDISAEQSVTISKVLYFVKIMRQHVNNERFTNLDTKPNCQKLLKVLREKLNDRFSAYEENELLTQSTFLDPRFKQYGFNSELKFKQTVDKLKTRLQVPTSVFPTTASGESQISNIQQSKNPAFSSSKPNIWDTFDSMVKTHVVQNPRSAAILEIDSYLKEPYLDRQGNPLKWWNDRRLIYPILYDLVQKRLCITATSVPCERVFSKAGQILTEKRSRLKSDKVSKVLFLHNNLN